MSSETVTSTVESAAANSEEQTFLSLIASNILDPQPKEAYCNWLKKTGDNRFEFVRQFIKSCAKLSTKTEFPDADKFPEAWTNMLGLQLFRGIVEFDLIEVKDLVLQLALPAVAIKTTPSPDDTMTLGSTKFGGCPDLPSSFTWPRCAESIVDEYPAVKDGCLGFLAQISMTDMRTTLIASRLPEKGLLSFFAYENDGFQPGVAATDVGDTRIFNILDGTDELERTARPEDTEWYTDPAEPCRLVMTETWDLPHWSPDEGPEEYANRMVELEEAYGEKYDDDLDDLHEKLSNLRYKCIGADHHLLGYSIHNRTSEPSPGSDWVHLLCLSSDDNTGWNWCDGEHLSIFSHQEDLRNGTFKRVFGYAS